MSECVPENKMNITAIVIFSTVWRTTANPILKPHSIHCAHKAGQSLSWRKDEVFQYLMSCYELNFFVTKQIYR